MELMVLHVVWELEIDNGVDAEGGWEGWGDVDGGDGINMFDSYLNIDFDKGVQLCVGVVVPRRIKFLLTTKFDCPSIITIPNTFKSTKRYEEY